MDSPVQFLSKFRFGAFELDAASGELRKAGIPIKLRLQAIQVLVMLVDRAGQVVTREEIRARLWSDNTFVDFERSINFCVNQIRGTLGDDAENPRYVETLPRRGYRFIASVTVEVPKGPVATAAVASITTGLARGAGESSAASSTSSGFKVVPARAARAPLVLWTLKPVLAIVAGAVFAIVAVALAMHRWSLSNRRLNLENLQITKLTENGRVGQMAISPDGLHVTYALRDGINQSLWVREVSTRREVQILPSDTVNFAGLAFSPDGNFIYFIRSERSNPVFGYLYRMPAAGGAVQTLIRDADTPVSFSPNGQRFVYTRGIPTQNVIEVRIANANGEGDTLLRKMSGFGVYEPGPTWSPDGRTIAVTLHMAGEQPAFVLYTLSLDNGTARQIYSSATDIGRPVWLPGGKALLVTLKEPRSHRGQLWTISYPEGEAHRFSNDLSDYSSAIDSSTDAKTLATIVSARDSDIWVAPAENLSRVRQVTSGEPSLFEVQELANGKLLASGEDLWIMNRDGSQRSRFLEIRNPDWIQRCGRFVVFTTNDAGKNVLMRVRMDGSAPAALASGDVLSPTCSADGEFVFYFNFTHPEKIRRIPIEGGPSTEIGDVLGDTLFGPLCISPDGKLVAYPYQRFAPPLVALVAIPAGGGSPVREFPLPGRIDGLRWSSDGKALQYLLTRDSATNLWEQPLAGGRPKQLTKFTSGQIFDFSWTSDGKQLLLARGKVTRDLVLLSNLR